MYPYPSVDKVIPLMAEGKILPYLDIPFQHANKRILKLMKRPGSSDRVLERIKKNGVKYAPSLLFVLPLLLVSQEKQKKSFKNY